MTGAHFDGGRGTETPPLHAEKLRLYAGLLKHEGPCRLGVGDARGEGGLDVGARLVALAPEIDTQAGNAVRCELHRSAAS